MIPDKTFNNLSFIAIALILSGFMLTITGFLIPYSIYAALLGAGLATTLCIISPENREPY